VVTPRIEMLSPTLLAAPGACQRLAACGLDFPFLLRSPGFHTGQHFLCVNSAEELAAAAASLPGKEVMAIEYLDARGRDGKTRKYRVMIIDGRMYPLHLAVSEQWKVHYFTAAMELHAEHQAEEAAFLN